MPYWQKEHMVKKFFSFIVAMLILLTSVCTFLGCSKDNGLSTDPLTINVRVRNAGYGKTYIEKLAEQFNETFKEEGYAVNVVPAREDLVGDVVLREIYTNGGIDVYFTDGITAQNAANHAEYGQTCADLTELVYNKKAIKADGSEEDKTVAEKLSLWDTSSLFYSGKVYGIPFAASFGVMGVNTKVLAGYDLEAPRTTNEMFYAAEKIMEDANDTNIFPFTYALSDNIYIMSTINPWIAQYNGEDEFNKFWSFENTDGTAMTDEEISQVFGYESVREALEVVYQMSDYNMAAPGSAVHEFKTAQSLIMKGDAVFYSVGDWMFNEEFYGFPSFLKDVTCVNPPLLSALGEKVFGPNTTYGYSLELADKILSAIAKYVDQGKLAKEVKPLVEEELSVTLLLEDVTTICERRGLTRCNVAPNVIVSEKSEKKDIAGLFLRFVASTDGGKIFAAESRTTYCYALDSVVDSEYPWVNGQNIIANSKYFNPIQADIYGFGNRAEYGLTGIFPAPCMDSITVINDILEENNGKGITRYNDKSLTILAGTENLYFDAANAKCDAMVKAAKNALEKGANGGWSKK